MDIGSIGRRILNTDLGICMESEQRMERVRWTHGPKLRFRNGAVRVLGRAS